MPWSANKAGKSAERRQAIKDHLRVELLPNIVGHRRWFSVLLGPYSHAQEEEEEEDRKKKKKK